MGTTAAVELLMIQLQHHALTTTLAAGKCVRTPPAIAAPHLMAHGSWDVTRFAFKVPAVGVGIGVGTGALLRGSGGR